jgi:hypothetical protein
MNNMKRKPYWPYDSWRAKISARVVAWQDKHLSPETLSYLRCFFSGHLVDEGMFEDVPAWDRFCIKCYLEEETDEFYKTLKDRIDMIGYGIWWE